MASATTALCVAGAAWAALPCASAKPVWPLPSSFRSVFTVTTAADTVDAVPGDGVCQAAGEPGTCTVRAAVMEANARPEASPYLVSIPAGTYWVSLPGDSEDQAAGGDIDIRTSMTLRGAGREQTIIHGPDLELDHAFEVFWEGVATFQDLTVCCGSGGAIRNRQGQLVLDRVTLRDNVASFGGGVANDGIMTVTQSAFLRNTAAQGGGLVSFTGGSLTISRTLFDGNGDSQGGGLKVQSALDMSECTIQNNLGSHGGGIQLGEQPAKVIRDTTIAHNHAGGHVEPPWHGYGGGLWNQAPDVRLVNVTLSDNWGQGGGIYNLGTMTVTNCTLAYNGTDSWGAAISNASALWMGNSIVGPSSAASCDVSRSPLTSLGHDLDRDGSCGLAGAGDLSLVDPRLLALGDNGGAVWTHALEAESPAVDAAEEALCPATDARGRLRPYGAACDIGAFEWSQEDTVPTSTATPLPTACPTPPPPTGAYLPLAERQAPPMLCGHRHAGGAR